MAIFDTVLAWFRGGRALAETRGQQYAVPSTSLVADTAMIGADGALQIAAVWACVTRRAAIVASLPFFAYQRLGVDGHKDVEPARGSRLYSILHHSPNERMTAYEFWFAMMMSLDLRGNAYARIDRDEQGEALAMWPMPADQVEHRVLDDGTSIYLYRIDQDIIVLAEANVLHLKGPGNGTTGLPKLEYMRATTDEASKAQTTASRLFGTNGKPTGVLMVDSVLRPQQREAIKRNFGEMVTANTGRLFVLEANMKYQQLSLSPEDQQLLESRQFSIEEICRWFDVPPVMVYHSNVTTWGSGVEQIIDGWHKVTLAPLLKNIEQAVSKRVLTPKQRAAFVVEFNLDALLRGNIKDRFEVYAKAVQNGLKTRNECRQLENDPPVDGGDELTAQINLAPLDMLGRIQSGGSNAGSQDPLAQ